MKYRIKKYYNDYGVLMYVPQYRFCFMWFAFKNCDYEDIEYKEEGEAIKYLKAIVEDKRRKCENYKKNVELRKNKSMYNACDIS